jgi:carbamoyl-phosphate synthase small subunit
MGHQLLARALGAKTYKLKFGHHGVNHPVKDGRDGRVVITSQNHGFCVDLSEIRDASVSPSFVSLNDGTLEGFRSEKLRFESVQFHPESNPGPRDGSFLFDHFIQRFLQ